MVTVKHFPSAILISCNILMRLELLSPIKDEEIELKEFKFVQLVSLRAGILTCLYSFMPFLCAMPTSHLLDPLFKIFINI